MATCTSSGRPVCTRSTVSVGGWTGNPAVRSEPGQGATFHGPFPTDDVDEDQPGAIGVAAVDYALEVPDQELNGGQRHHRSSLMREDHERMSGTDRYVSDGELPAVDTLECRRQSVLDRHRLSFPYC